MTVARPPTERAWLLAAAGPDVVTGMTERHDIVRVKPQVGTVPQLGDMVNVGGRGQAAFGLAVGTEGVMRQYDLAKPPPEPVIPAFLARSTVLVFADGRLEPTWGTVPGR